MSSVRPLFSCYGVELEYMVVRDRDLGVLPAADKILVDAAGKPSSDVDRNDITWSNELCAHVIELKTTEPAATVDGLSARFAAEVREINSRLSAHRARLLPTAMHPWMRPSEAVLWPHEYSEVYQTFDRIFDCRGHGWSNLQSVHINLPFSNDEEFGRLHAAVRLVLPLLPALAASSPIFEGIRSGFPDNRLAFYRQNSARIPSIAGRVIPEQVYTEADYRRVIFDTIARDLKPSDPDGVLDPEFTNSRGAIARFCRGSIEIRLLDIQECPAADLAIVRTVIALLKDLVAEKHVSLSEQKAWAVEPLAALFNQCVEKGGDAHIEHPALMRVFGINGVDVVTAGDFWKEILGRPVSAVGADADELQALEVLRTRGNLATRMLGAISQHPTPAELYRLYEKLAGCLESNTPFTEL